MAGGRRTVAVTAAVFTIASCGASKAEPVAGGCPVKPLNVVVTVDQWGSLVRSLAGSCGRVTSIVTSSAGDPHDYEPTPADGASFAKADLVVKNGLRYDVWADKAIATLSHRPTVIDAGSVVGARNGDNPHRWYSPDDVEKFGDAVTSSLRALSPQVATYFASQHSAWLTSMAPYRDAFARAGSKARGKAYAATESVFDLMATALGMTDATPDGFRRAEANGSDPAPGDIAAFEKLLAKRNVAVLIFNTQTSSAIASQIRSSARDAKIPVVEVTESVKPGAAGFVDWQVGELDALTKALT
jgi:zinc/manganese transport system substrate-binding protein